MRRKKYSTCVESTELFVRKYAFHAIGSQTFAIYPALGLAEKYSYEQFYRKKFS